MKLTVVIVNYNVCYFVEQCLDSVLRAIEGMDAEIIVVDNQSTDGSVPYLRSRFPSVRIIESHSNLGFAKANNIGIRLSDAQYVLLLNPDTFVSENVLRDAVAFMDAHSRAGGVGVMMHNPDGTVALESRRGLPTPWVSLLKMLGRSSRYYMSHLPWDAPAQIEVISGAFCMLRREALNQIGLLDEDYFMYGEDIDLSYRLLKGGWQNWYLPLKIVHYKGESTQKSSYRYVHVFYQAMLIFFRKHYGHQSLLTTVPIKAAIYFRAFMALVSMLYSQMRSSLGFFDKKGGRCFYRLIGSEEMLRQCTRLLQSKGLPIGNATCKDWQYDVYDTQSYKYSEIIDSIKQSAPNRKDVVCFLGTYNTQTKVLITPKEILQ